MKLLSFVIEGRSSYGAVKDNGVVDLGARLAAQGCATLRQLLEANRLADAARLVATTRPGPTPLQRRLTGLGRVLGVAVVGMSTVVFMLGVLAGRALWEMAITAVSLVVGRGRR